MGNNPKAAPYAAEASAALAGMPKPHKATANATANPAAAARGADCPTTSKPSRTTIGVAAISVESQAAPSGS